MERLTRRINGVVVYVGAKNSYSTGKIPCEVEPAGAREMMDRLAAYADTRLTPEEIDMDHEAAEQLRQLCQGCDLDRLEELAEADKDGRLVVLPCKVGDRLYEVTGRKTISVYKVRAIRAELFSLFIEWDIVEGFVWQSLSGINADEIGKTVFLTREEAERALKEREDNA